jgi:RNA polymerase sigma-70 factor (ECF subfamily)
METERVFDDLVDQFYRPLYRFAFSLAQAEADACDLVQQTFYLWATKGHQLRDPTKARMWLFTTLHREFLNRRRRLVRFPHHELLEVEAALPPVEPGALTGLDAEFVLAALAKLDEAFRAPVVLFFLEDYSYQEIATTLDIPLGTVKSRLSRGLRHLQAGLQGGKTDEPPALSSSSP